jgi:hypothetical protein
LWDYRNSVWEYRESTWTLDSDLVGYEVTVAGNRIGRVVRASSSSSAAYLVVDAAPSVDGLRLVPACAVTSMRHDDRTVMIDVTSSELAAAPPYVGDQLDDAVRAAHDRYFSDLLLP